MSQQSLLIGLLVAWSNPLAQGDGLSSGASTRFVTLKTVTEDNVVPVRRRRSRTALTTELTCRADCVSNSLCTEDFFRCKGIMRMTKQSDVTDCWSATERIRGAVVEF